MTNAKRNDLIYTLSKKSLYLIVIYYIFLLTSGIFFVVLSDINLHLKSNLIKTTIIVSLSVSNMFCSIRYLKLLYKACIEDRVISPYDDQKNVQFGNILYFLLRPLYAIVFVIFSIIALLSGFFIISPSLDYIINDRFFYLCLIISCLIGYSVGTVLDNFEMLCNKKIQEIFSKDRESAYEKQS